LKETHLLKKTALSIFVILFAIQFISVDKTNPPVDENLTLQAPQEVMSLLKQSCYDCHSYETRWPSYASVAPISFVVASHVKDARKAMNFSTWNKMDKKVKEERLKRAIKTVNNGLMALPSYVSAHEEAKLNRDDKMTLAAWFNQELETLQQK
jgi:hypothetical protein